MTTAADDSAVEDAFEALLAGRPVPEGAAGLAAFTEAVRASATRPGRPNAALAELLATGLLTDQSSPSVRTARSAGSAPVRRPSRVRTRRRPAMIFSALIVKFLSAGAVAQAATGATVAVVAFTGVGAVGALPDPVQDTFATVVAEITSLEPPTSEETTEAVVPEETVADEAGTTDETSAVIENAGVVDVQAWIDAGPDAGETFGAWVVRSKDDAGLRAQMLAGGLNFGDLVSEAARQKGIDKRELSAQGVDLDALAEDDAPETEPDVADDAAETATEIEETAETDAGTAVEDRGSRGNGNGGNGKGNGKN